MPAGRPVQRQQGFTLLAVLCAMALLAIATQGVVFVLSQQAMREREALLLQAGRAYAEAIRSYYEASPGGVRTYPRELSELLEDRRFVGVRRHLRRAYPDPITGGEWGVVRTADGTAQGVFSLSRLPTIRSAAIDLGELRLPPAQRYEDWKFVYAPTEPAASERR